jgi:hypothetical protein
MWNGRAATASQPDRHERAALFPEYQEFRRRTRERAGKPGESAAPAPADDRRDELSPREAIAEVIDSAHSAVAADLLTRVVKQPPEFLERLVLQLLVRMGYGGLETPTEHLGRTGDAGLDGLIRLDKLGLDVVYVQAKRYTDRHVGRPDIQAFVGALHGAQASRGVFITTSRFSADALDYADLVNARLVLIDGPELAALVIEHGCGVALLFTPAASAGRRTCRELFFPAGDPKAGGRRRGGRQKCSGVGGVGLLDGADGLDEVGEGGHAGRCRSSPLRLGRRRGRGRRCPRRPARAWCPGREG